MLGLCSPMLSGPTVAASVTVSCCYSGNTPSGNTVLQHRLSLDIENTTPLIEEEEEEEKKSISEYKSKVVQWPIPLWVFGPVWVPVQPRELVLFDGFITRTICWN